MHRASLALAALTLSAPAHEWSQLPPLPDALGLAAPFAGISNGALLVAGGANFPDKMPWDGGRKVWHDGAWILEQPGSTWRAAGKLPRPLAYGVSLTVNGGILCAGGSDAEKHYDSVFMLHWEQGKLVQRDQPPALPIPLAAAAGAVCRDEIVYIACGSSEPGELRASNRVFVTGFRHKDMAWRDIPALPAEPRILPVAAGSGDDFYLFGGAALEPKDGKIVRRYLTDAWRYSPGTGWKRLADLPKPCVAAPSPAPVTGGAILLIGGDDGSLAGFSPPAKHPGFPGAILRYDIAKDSWSEDGKAPAPRATLPCVAWESFFVFPSGEVRPGVRSPEMWRLSRAGEKR